MSSMKFPAGYRFKPTDQEVIVEYLHRKLLNILPEAWNHIKEVDLYKYHPTELDPYKKNSEEKSYFFTSIERKYSHGDRPSRLAKNGYWKTTSVEDVKDGNKNVIAKKRSLVFYDGKGKDAKKSNWIMHEYKIERDHLIREFGHNFKGPMKLDNWVVCSIHEHLNSTQRWMRLNKKEQHVSMPAVSMMPLTIGEHINEHHLNDQFPPPKRRRTDLLATEQSYGTENGAMADTIDKNYPQKNIPKDSSLMPQQEGGCLSVDEIEQRLDFSYDNMNELNFENECLWDSWVDKFSFEMNDTNILQENPSLHQQ